MKTDFIALLTDFSLSTPYVGLLKSVILSKNPAVSFIDLTHDIPPQNVRTASFWVMSCLKYLPLNALLLSVIDPGVGGKRKIIWAKTNRHQIISPDNGTISWIEKEEKLREIRCIENKNLFLDKISFTFHARDIMAPAAAKIADGFPERKIGQKINKFVKFPFPRPDKKGRIIRGEIMCIDNFGNAITNIAAKEVKSTSEVKIKKISLAIRKKYSDVKTGEELALEGSFSFLELSIRNGSFANKHKIKVGERVEIIV